MRIEEFRHGINSNTFALEDLEWGGACASEEVFFDAKQQNEKHCPLLPHRYRPILPKDRPRIQQLHEEWFPVSYQSDFYDHLVMGKMCHSGEDLYTNVAVNAQDEIVACLVGAVVPSTKLNSASRQLLLPASYEHTKLCYIMTLGTVPEYRKGGLASTLVEQCIRDVILPHPECGALYLHVITLNQSAIRFYERLGFWRVQEIKDYYTIDGKQYNCYLYAKYFHGNRGHLDMFKVLSWWISSIWQRFKKPLSSLVKSRAYR
jgi:ribosomal protein S18 acetylase RimI-like enzyme